LDLFLFYIFWESCSSRCIFLIGIWGGPRSEYAAIKFFLYTLVGSVFMLLDPGIYFYGGDPHTFDMTGAGESGPALLGAGLEDPRLAGSPRSSSWRSSSVSPSKWPMFPFSHCSPTPSGAPTAVSVILAASF